MITALNRTQGRRSTDGGMFAGADAALSRLDEHLWDEAEAIYTRVLANTNEFSTINRREHALAVTGVVMKARRKENH